MSVNYFAVIVSKASDKEIVERCWIVTRILLFRDIGFSPPLLIPDVRYLISSLITSTRLNRNNTTIIVNRQKVCIDISFTHSNSTNHSSRLLLSKIKLNRKPSLTKIKTIVLIQYWLLWVAIEEAWQITFSMFYLYYINNKYLNKYLNYYNFVKTRKFVQR